jgi:hypothetical protein
MIGWGVALILYVLGIVVTFGVIDSGIKLGEIDLLPPASKWVGAIMWPLMAIAALLAANRKRKRRKRSADDMSSL